MADATARPGLFDWHREKRKLLQRITTTRMPLRLFLKVRDDAEMLARWYAHHSRIVPPEAITIFDNGSENPDCLAFYETLPPEVLVVHYEGFHNDLHTTIAEPELYAAMARACDYFLFIDCDEFLYHFDGAHLRRDASIPERLSGQIAPVLPTTRLDNLAGDPNRFPVSPASIQGGTFWGKPILRSDAVPVGHINHNCQIPAAHFTRDFEAGFVLLHVSRVNSEKRILVALQKLRQRGFGTEGAMREAALAADPDALTDSQTRNYVREVQVLTRTPYEHPENPARLERQGDGTLVVSETDDRAVFTDLASRELLTGWVTDTARRIAMLKRRQGNRARSARRGAFTHPPDMTPGETTLLANVLRRKSFLLEFGAGGSTLLAAAMGVTRIVSVDSRAEWLATLAEAPELASVAFTPSFVDTGLSADGDPSDATPIRTWPDYYTKVWSALDGREPDIVLIDGHFRMACLLSALLRTGPETLIAVHDFWNRRDCRAALPHLVTVARCERLGVFKARASVDWRQVAVDLSAHVLDPG